MHYNQILPTNLKKIAGYIKTFEVVLNSSLIFLLLIKDTHEYRFAACGQRVHG